MNFSYRSGVIHFLLLLNSSQCVDVAIGDETNKENVTSPVPVMIGNTDTALLGAAEITCKDPSIEKSSNGVMKLFE